MTLLTTLSLLTTIILQLPTGAFADVVGRRVSCIVGSTIVIGAYIVLGLSSDKYYFFFGSILNGVGTAFISGANVSLLYDTLKELGIQDQFGRIRSNAVVGLQVAIIISSIAGGYMYGFFASLPYFAVAGSYVLVTMFYFMFVEPKIDSQKYSVHAYFNKIKEGFGQIFKTDYSRRLGVFYIVVGGIATTFQFSFNQIYAAALGYSEVDRGWLFAIIRFVNAFIIIKLFKVDKFFLKSRPMLRFSIFVVIALIAGAIDIKSIGTIILFASTLMMTLRLIIFDKLVNDVFESSSRATALSALSMLMSGFQMILLMIGGLIFDHYFPGIVYTGIGIFVLIFVLPFVWNVRSKQNVQPA